jgi:hypothetical protein
VGSSDQRMAAVPCSTTTIVLPAPVRRRIDRQARGTCGSGW